MVTKEDIISKVKAIMNEIGEDTNESLLDEDTIRIDEYIESCIGDALSLVILNSVNPVNPKKCTLSATGNGDGSGYVILPDDFVKLLSFRMNGWKRAVSEAYPLESETAKEQGNIYSRGTKSKPVCVLSYSPEGKKTIEYYSVDKDGNNEISVFVYESSYDENSDINMNASSVEFKALCYMTASLVYSIFESPNTAREMQKTAINLLRNVNVTENQNR